MHATIEELAKAEGVTPSYMSRVLRLTLLAPDIVEAILDGRQPEGCGWRICLRRFRWSGWSSVLDGAVQDLTYAAGRNAGYRTATGRLH